MICRCLRRFSVWQSCLLLAVSVAFGGLAGFVVPPPLPAEDEAPAITIRGPEAPPAALAQAMGGRSEKQAQANRQVLQKPGRLAQLATADLQQLHARRSIVRRQLRTLPRRMLSAQRSTLHTSGDDGDPSLS